MRTVAIPLAKDKLFMVLLGMCGFVALGIWLGGRAARGTYSGFAEVKAWFAALTCTLFFGAGVLLMLFRLFDHRAGVVLNEEGLHRLGIFGYRPVIPWEHITHVSVTKVRSTRILLIHTDDMERTINGMRPPLRWIQRISSARYGAVHSLSSNALKCDLAELQRLIESGIAFHRNER